MVENLKSQSSPVRSLSLSQGRRRKAAKYAENISPGVRWSFNSHGLGGEDCAAQNRVFQQTLKPVPQPADYEILGSIFLEPQDRPASEPVADLIERRAQPRFRLEVDISVQSRTCGLLKGHTVDISESGISAMLTMEVPLGELVEVTFTVPFGRVAVYAMVRQRNAFRYGFQFVHSPGASDIIRQTCRHLSVEQTIYHL